MNIERDCDGKAVRALFPQDPGNVHHSYLGDPQRIRNIHAGPKETHIFHLHAHQWLHTPASDRSIYLDSEAISPGSAFTYDINFGGGGNRNLTVGDSIYHCHLYPHFAGGMWSLIRNHDVFEAGTPDRNLPDGEIKQGVPQPAVVPIPDRGMPPMPTYKGSKVKLADGKTVDRPAFPGYPFYIAAKAGRRPSQPPRDMVFDGGLPRHLITDVDKAILGRRGEFDVELVKADVKLLPAKGTPLELTAQAFHAGELEGGFDARTIYKFPAAAYPAFTPLGKRSVFFVNGQKPKPGAPYADPCPRGTKERKYRVAMLQLDLLINREGWHDPQARIMALEEDVPGLIGGLRAPEPLAIRANSGECVVIETTNLLPDVLEADDFQIFTPTDIVGQHVHLVKFDVTSSDGAANGWNYEDGTFAPEEVVARIEAANAAGGAFEADGTLKAKGRRKFLRPERHPRLRIAPLGTQTTVQRWWADPIIDDQGRDRTVQGSFTHDHFAPSSHQQHGLYGGLISEPAGSIWRDPKTGEIFGTRDDGGPTSFHADIIGGKDVIESFREYNLAVHDFALAFDAFGDPVNPPPAMEAALPIAVLPPKRPRPEAISADDPGTMMISYRNEPIPLRIAKRVSRDRWVQKDGIEGDPAFVFSSKVHGDPFTPLLEGYPGDRIKIRILEGAQEEMHVFGVNGVRWLFEENDPDSGFHNGMPFGISQHFELVFNLPPIDREFDTADFMYASRPDTDLWNGTWGLLRSYRRKQPFLLPLPNNRDFERKEDVPVCPEDAPRRFYEVHAITAKGNLPGDRLVYNEKFDLYDPDGILFVRKEHLEDLRCGKRKPEPLILRAAAGECIVVKLVNELPECLPQTPHWSHHSPITPRFNVNQVVSSNHVGLHPQLVDYDVNRSDGANIGLNRKQTVQPGESIVYEWYAGEMRVISRPTVPIGSRVSDLFRGPERKFEGRPVEFGVVNLRDFGDIVNHPMHGAFGTLIVEPEGAKWETPEHTEAEALVYYRKPGEKRWSTFREHVVLLQNDIPLHSGDPRFQCADRNLNCGTAIRNLEGTDDARRTPVTRATTTGPSRSGRASG